MSRREDTIGILRGLKERYEVHHGIEITDPAIVAAAQLSHRYIADRQLPDKAIDLIDEAGARIRMEIDSKPEEMDRLDRRIIQLRIEEVALKKEDDEASKKRLATLRETLGDLQKQYADFEEIWKAEKAMLQGRGQGRLEKARLELMRRAAAMTCRRWPAAVRQNPELEKNSPKRRPPSPSHPAVRNSVNAEEIAEVVPSGRASPCPRCLKRRTTAAHGRSAGQARVGNRSLKILANAIRRSRAGLRIPSGQWFIPVPRATASADRTDQALANSCSTAKTPSCASTCPNS